MVSDVNIDNFNIDNVKHVLYGERSEKFLIKNNRSAMCETYAVISLLQRNS